MYGDSNFSDKMDEKGHMIFNESAELAVKSKSRLLWLTHFSPALTDPFIYSERVKKIFSDTYCLYGWIENIIKIRTIS